MPAIRYRDRNSGALLTQLMVDQSRLVEVRMHGGGTKSLLWVGFICMEGTKTLDEGCFAKMNAIEVTSGDGICSSKWVHVGFDRAVLA